jgi:uncharacterized protein YfkK (UPF0435 family)
MAMSNAQRPSTGMAIRQQVTSMVRFQNGMMWAEVLKNPKREELVQIYSMVKST